MDVSVSGTIDQKTYLKKFRGGFNLLNPPGSAYEYSPRIDPHPLHRVSLRAAMLTARQCKLEVSIKPIYAVLSGRERNRHFSKQCYQMR